MADVMPLDPTRSNLDTLHQARIRRERAPEVAREKIAEAVAAIFEAANSFRDALSAPQQYDDIRGARAAAWAEMRELAQRLSVAAAHEASIGRPVPVAGDER